MKEAYPKWSHHFVDGILSTMRIILCSLEDWYANDRLQEILFSLH
jgi:hypothetical protein